MAAPEDDRHVLLEDVDLHDLTADECRIILVGKTGNGKSSTGNRLLDREDDIVSLDNMNEDRMNEDGSDDDDKTIKSFTVSPFPNSCTPKCQYSTGDAWGMKLRVVDTPGFFSTQDPLELVSLEVTRSLSLCAPGPHVILLVVRIDVKFSGEEKQVIDKVFKSLGAGVERRLIVVFTFGHILQGQSLDRLLAVSPDLNNMVKRAGGRCVVLTKDNREAEVRELLEKIKALIAENREKMSYLTNATFQKLSEEICKELTKIRKENPQLSISEALNKVRANILRRNKTKFILKLVGIVVGSTVFGVLVGVSGGAALGATPLILAGMAEAIGIGATCGAAGTSIISILAAIVASVKQKKVSPKDLKENNMDLCVIQ